MAFSKFQNGTIISWGNNFHSHKLPRRFFFSFFFNITFVFFSKNNVSNSYACFINGNMNSILDIQINWFYGLSISSQVIYSQKIFLNWKNFGELMIYWYNSYLTHSWGRRGSIQIELLSYNEVEFTRIHLSRKFVCNESDIKKFNFGGVLSE